jgi:predicted nucleic acid-binding protein
VIVLDTTVLVYAVGETHTFQKPCQRILRAVRDGDLIATTTIEVIQEFAHVRAGRRGRTDAVDLARDYLELLSPLLIVEESDVREGLRLFGEAEALGCFDAVLAAATHAAGADAIVSADGAFSEIPSIRHVIPDADGVKGLLEG